MIQLGGITKATVCYVPSSSLAASVSFWIDGKSYGTDSKAPYCLNKDKNMDEPDIRSDGIYTMKVQVQNASKTVIENVSVTYEINAD